jgi:predicted  nucleic acid-binding Zn-ribbon protein
MTGKLTLAKLFWGYTMAAFVGGGAMARKDRLTQVAVGIGKAMGKADRKAQQVAKAGQVAKEELEEIAKQVEALKRQLQKTTKRLKTALR